ncbi:MAG: DUF1343 domain-containing protein [Muribaculaceae bacterium]|nr:DUF1343 domain-containing protein [Muribaculaceae bacterium]
MNALGAAGCDTAKTQQSITSATSDEKIIVGADQPDVYVPLLKGKRVALLSNHSGLTSDGSHVLDLMLAKGINVTTIFSPEHGFRGNADAGQHVASGIDEKTGIPIASLYDGKSPRPSEETMQRFDVIVVDIQDVGLRFYTYYVTMLHLMEAAVQYNKEFVVLDRPNPNGMTVDGPILDMKLKSGVGALPIPTVHGLTLGELARMIVGEGWLLDGKKLDVKVVTCKNYTHESRYVLPVPPSPNLPNMTAIYLYPSLCYFEGTSVSLGRGTDWPFQVYGHPEMTDQPFTFTPESRPGAKNPPQLGKECHGKDLTGLNHEEIIAAGINLEYVIDAYQNLHMGEKFFTPFFDKLMGRSDIKQMIMDGKTAAQIKATWSDDVARFKEQRRRYLLYPESGN